jgi:hypothetical protein
MVFISAFFRQLRQPVELVFAELRQTPSAVVLVLAAARISISATAPLLDYSENIYLCPSSLNLLKIGDKQV